MIIDMSREDIYGEDLKNFGIFASKNVMLFAWLIIERVALQYQSL